MNINSVTSQTIQNLPSSIKDASATSSAKGAEKAEFSKGASLDRADLAASKTEISENAQALSMVQDLVSTVPDVREQKVAELKARIAAGTYQVSAQEVASRLVDEHLSSAVETR